MFKANFEEYAAKYQSIEAEIKTLELMKDELRKEVLAEMAEEGFSEVKTPIGKWGITKLKKWTYPEYVTNMVEAAEAAKIKAQTTKEATYTEQDSLRFTKVSI